MGKISEKLKKLLRLCSDWVISDEEREAQRKSFAYGNTKLHNDDITREIVEKEAQKVDRQLVED